MLKHTTSDWMDGLATAEAVQKGKVSIVETVQAAIDRAEAVNPKLNGLSEKLYERALQQAAKAKPGEGVFSGVPMLIKDLFLPVQGARMSNGSLLGAHTIAPFDAEVTTRLNKAGTITFGTTTAPEFGTSYTTESRLFGATRNPWNIEHVAGGSSGGAAVMVAARVLPFALGNDGGGSLRVPASACGIFGFKPSRGLVPMGPAVGEGWAGMSTSHVMSISVRDNAAALDVLGGADLGAPYAAPQQQQSFLSSTTGPGPKGLRVGVIRHMAPWTTHADCLEAVDETVALLQSLGHHVEETTLPVDAMEFLDQVFTIIGSQTTSLLRFMGHMAGQPMDHSLLEARHRVILREKGNMSGADYADAVNYIHAFGRRMAELMTRYDVLLNPTLAQPLPKIGTLMIDDSHTLADLLHLFHGFSPFTAFFNASGQPAMSVPLHWSANGLPVGSHFAAAFGQDALLFALAAQLEEARPWADRLPPVSAI